MTFAQASGSVDACAGVFFRHLLKRGLRQNLRKTMPAPLTLRPASESLVAFHGSWGKLGDRFEYYISLSERILSR